jgi:hypothetical protein
MRALAVVLRFGGCALVGGVMGGLLGAVAVYGGLCVGLFGLDDVSFGKYFVPVGFVAGVGGGLWFAHATRAVDGWR